MGGAIRETGGAKDEIGGADQRKYSPNDQCIVGKHIKPVLESMFNKIEEAFVRQLSIMTLRDCINEIKKQIQ